MYQQGQDNREQLESMLEALDEKETLLRQQTLDIQAMEVELKTARERCLLALDNLPK